MGSITVVKRLPGGRSVCLLSMLPRLGRLIASFVVRLLVRLDRLRPGFGLLILFEALSSALGARHRLLLNAFLPRSAALVLLTTGALCELPALTLLKGSLLGSFAAAGG